MFTTSDANTQNKTLRTTSWRQPFLTRATCLMWSLAPKERTPCCIRNASAPAPPRPLSKSWRSSWDSPTTWLPSWNPHDNHPYLSVHLMSFPKVLVGYLSFRGSAHFAQPAIFFNPLIPRPPLMYLYLRHNPQKHEKHHESKQPFGYALCTLSFHSWRQRCLTQLSHKWQAGPRPIKYNIIYLLISVWFLNTLFGCVLQLIIFKNMVVNPLSLIVAHPSLTNESWSPWSKSFFFSFQCTLCTRST